MSYREKYLKYKNKYLALKKELSEGSFFIEEEEAREAQELELNEIEDEPSISRINADRRPYIPDIPGDVDDQFNMYVYSPTLASEDKIHDVGKVGTVKGKSMNVYDLQEADKIIFGKSPDKTKVLMLDTLDHFDSFTDKYGNVIKSAGDNILTIKWDEVSSNYKGLYINPGLAADRFDMAVFKDNTYKSWWTSDMEQFDVLIFVK